MRAPGLHAATLLYLLAACPPSADAQVDQQRAQEFFREAIALCERDGGRLDGPVLVMPGGGHGFSDSHGAVVIPGEGTVYFGDYRQSGEWGVLEASNGVLLSTDGRTRRLPGPARRDSVTIAGDGWTFRAAAGWVVREGARRGDYVVMKP